jgi:hypothetical protein
VTTNDTTRRVKPPLPKAAYKVVNPVLKAVLRSPLHRLVSESLMALRFQGIKSGARYSIPVGYLQRGEKLFVFSHSAWSNNFRGGAPVWLRLRGKDIRGTARVIEDRDRVGAIVGLLVAKHGDAMAERMGLVVDGQVAPQGTTLIEITLEEPAP